MGPVLSKVHLQIIQLMATTHRRTTKKMVVKNTVKLKKTKGIPLAHPVSREKGTSFHTNHWGKKGSSWRQMMMKLWKSWEKFAKDSIIVKIIKHAEDRFAASLADDLRSLPEKEKFMAKLEIRNVIYKFQMKKFNSPKRNETRSNYNIYNPSPFEGPFRVDNNSYLQGTFRSTGNSHNFSVPANNFTCNKTANGNNIYENL